MQLHAGVDGACESKCMQSAPINMLVVVVGLISGSIHVLPPPHISLPLYLITRHYLQYHPAYYCTAAANKLHVIVTHPVATCIHRERGVFLVGYPRLT